MCMCIYIYIYIYNYYKPFAITCDTNAINYGRTPSLYTGRVPRQ